MWKRGKVAAQTAVIVGLLLAARYGVEQADWEFVTASSLLTAVVSGGVFVAALVVAGTLTDYKESERMPAEIVASLQSIHTDARMFKIEKPAFDLEGLEIRLRKVVTCFVADLENPGQRSCVEAVNALSESFAEMDRLEVIATYISRLRGEQAAMRKAVLRTYHIQETDFVPSAFTLIWTIVLLAISLLLFVETESKAESYYILGAIFFFLIYLTRLLSILDTPFQPRESSQDDVDLKLLKEFAGELGAGMPSTDGSATIQWDARRFASEVAAELAKLSEATPPPQPTMAIPPPPTPVPPSTS
jgi:hypothetical protein